MFTAEEIGSSFCFLLPNLSARLEPLQGLLRGAPILIKHSTSLQDTAPEQDLVEEQRNL